MTGKRPICVIGNANIDLVVGSIADWPAWGTEVFLEHSDFRIGGSAANSAIALQRLGHPIGLVSACGRDALGEMIANRFAGPLDRIAERAERTSKSVGILQKGGERSFLSTDGHLDCLDLRFFLENLSDWPLDNALALVSGGFTMPALMNDHTQLLHWLKGKGAEIAIDPGWPGDGWTSDAISAAREWTAAADHVLLNEIEALGATGAQSLPQAADILDSLRPSGTRLVVKRGQAGASIYLDGTAIHEPASPRPIIDTVGAGDAFNAGYLSAIAEGLPDSAALKRGIYVAGHVISEFPRRFDPFSPNP